MTQPRLETLTLQTLASSAEAAGHALHAARAGSRRLLDVIDQRVTTVAADRLEPHARRVAGHVRDYGSLARDRAVQGVDTLGDLADAGLKRGAKGAAAQVKRMAKAVFQVQNPVLSKSLSTAARVSMPGARLAQVISERVAATTAAWPEAVAGETAKPKRRRVRVSARRKAGGATATAPKAVKTAKTAKAEKAATAGKATKTVRRTASTTSTAKTVKSATTRRRAATPAAAA
jgi:hypothetical protein